MFLAAAAASSLLAMYLVFFGGTRVIFFSFFSVVLSLVLLHSFPSVIDPSTPFPHTHPHLLSEGMKRVRWATLFCSQSDGLFANEFEIDTHAMVGVVSCGVVRYALGENLTEA